LLQMNSNILAAMWKIKERIYIIFISVLLSLIVNYILINYMWVNGVALASGILWIIFWIMTEYVLWKQFEVKFDYKYLFKNVSIIWTIWIISYIYIIPIFIWLNRFESLLLFSFYSIIYFIIFVFINLKEYKTFLWEIKNIKKW
jgi:O-antigen/teichoic acid export membrane protein